jgi:multidrug transporter EmrE-like cation transporter
VNKIINVVSLAALTSSLAVGQVLFKKVALAFRGHVGSQAAGVSFILMQPTLYAALTIYALSTVLWIWILTRVPLMQAYPWVAVGVAIVPVLGHYLFGERVAPAFWAGIVLMLMGLLLTQSASNAV